MAGPRFSDESLGYIVNSLGRLFALAVHRRIAPLGLHPGQLPVLLQLYEEGGRTQAELARTLGVEQPTMANTLQRMERDGLVERVPDPSDRRRALINLTAHARGLQPAVKAVLVETNAQAASGLNPEQLQAFRAAVAHLAGNLRDDITESTGGTA